MAGGVARNVDDLEVEAKSLQLLTIANPGQRFRHGFARRAKDPGSCGLAQGSDTAGVVRVVVRD